MGTRDLTLLTAIELAKEAEQRAASLYASVAEEASNPLVRRLLDELVQYERYHYEKLTELEQSLRIKGAFIRYEGRELLPVEPISEVRGIEGVQKTSAAKVIKQAIGFEKQAEERYAALAEQTADPDGRDMFERLAREEHNHYLALTRAYYDMANFRALR
jgi:rubrerythrin